MQVLFIPIYPSIPHSGTLRIWCTTHTFVKGFREHVAYGFCKAAQVVGGNNQASIIRCVLSSLSTLNPNAGLVFLPSRAPVSPFSHPCVIPWLSESSYLLSGGLLVSWGGFPHPYIQSNRPPPTVSFTVQ